jgi:hypothetical protein
MLSPPSHTVSISSAAGVSTPMPSLGSQIPQVMGPAPAATTTTAPPTHSEPIHTTVPKLELNGNNWAAFQMHFSEAMDTADRWGHFDGTKVRPPTANPTAGVTAKEKVAQALWDREDKIG